MRGLRSTLPHERAVNFWEAGRSPSDNSSTSSTYYYYYYYNILILLEFSGGGWVGMHSSTNLHLLHQSGAVVGTRAS